MTDNSLIHPDRAAMTTDPSGRPGRALVALHLQTDGRHPQELLSVTALRVDEQGVAGQRVRWMFRPVRPLSAAQVYRLGINPAELAAAGPWETLAGQVAVTLGTHPVLVYHGWAEVCLLQRYLPAWCPERVLAVHRLAQRLGADADATARWRAGCADADRAALLYHLLTRLVLAGGHDWSTAYGVAELRRPPTPVPQTERPTAPPPCSQDAPQTAGRDR